MKPTFFLLTTLIEMSECVSDNHTLFESEDKAMEQFKTEIAECAENFEGQDGEYLIELPTCKEWRNEDGYGFTVSIEEISPQ